MENKWLWLASNCVLNPKFRASKSPNFHILNVVSNLNYVWNE